VIPNKVAASQGMAFCAELEEDGIHPASYDGERSIYHWLGMATEEKCKCGAVLRRFERFNTRCWECSSSYLRSNP
jgi:hypothetical protein